MREYLMRIDESMEYAIRLSQPGRKYLGEEYHKLASLCEDIAIAQNKGAEATPSVASEFANAIRLFFDSTGAFREVVEHNAVAKEFTQNI